MTLIYEIEKYITDNYIDIPEEKWISLNQRYSKEELIEVLKYEILAGNICLPIKRLTEEDAEKSFIDLIDYQCKEIQVASDYFQQTNRFYCGSINSPSPARTWQNGKFLNGMLNAIWSLKCKTVNENTFRTCLSLRKYMASQFKPTVAKSVYEKFNARNILDFSAGWGDRLCGFYATENTKLYIGIDPNRNVYNDYYRQESFYKKYVNGKSSTFICSPAEEVVLDSEIVDLVFTSPPYFNVEKYTEDSNQSYKRYRKLNDWLDSFLFKAIDVSIKALKDDGYLIINISDVYSGHQINHICDPMNYYIQSLGMKYEGMLGMRMAKRPNSRASKGDGIFIEPMWVWRK